MYVCMYEISSMKGLLVILGSFLVVAMRNISLAFDLDDQKDSKGEHKPARLSRVPDLPAYTCYSLFPGTTVFGPFLTYSEHCKFLHPTPLVSSLGTLGSGRYAGVRVCTALECRHTSDCVDDCILMCIKF